ncbi:hypothetical protein AVEN_50353-1 [Araneus ventricosus]|uniref:Uncharacterized protein n=1 Tax=Araneus ventricosus TaxID=182803 RepID=A0A4Y2EAX8_ARAVE|nr:hypothetical protein AVEN_50353-1 [Araneus ventricosus]
MTIVENCEFESFLQPWKNTDIPAACRHITLKNNFIGFALNLHWSHLFKRCPNTDAINSVMELVMIFFYGNSNVERGFSVNKESVVENMKEETLIAQRLVYDAVMDHGKYVGSIDISKSLIHSYKNARTLLTEETKKREREKLENKVCESKKKKLDLEAKIAKVKQNATKEVEALTEEINSLNNIKL